MEKPERRRGRKILPVILLIIILLIVTLLIDGNTRLVVTEYELGYKNLPASFDGFRIVFISDTHASEFGKNNAKLLEKIKGAQPDIIVVGGDVIDHDKQPPLERQIEIAETLVDGLTQIAPVYYITGNHEWDSGGIRQLLPMLEERGVHILRNDYTVLESDVDGYAVLDAAEDVIILAGTDDPNGPADMIKPRAFVDDIRAAEGEQFIIMLEHRNRNLPLYSELNVDLVICGHAHGGLIRLPFTDGLIGPSREWFPSYTKGVYSMGDTNMVVSRGVGNHTGVPRFLNNPEVVVVTVVASS